MMGASAPAVTTDAGVDSVRVEDEGDICARCGETIDDVRKPCLGCYRKQRDAGLSSNQLGRGAKRIFESPQTTPERESAPLNDPDTLFGVSPQVREEACEKGVYAVENAPLPAVTPRTYVREVVDAAIPVIAGAAYKEAKARIEAVPNPHQFAGPVVRNAHREGFAQGIRAALAAIDKEGETSE